MRNPLLNSGDERNILSLDQAIFPQTEEVIEIPIRHREEGIRWDKLIAKAKQIEREKGTNVAHVFYGNIHWQPFSKQGKETSYTSPIFIAPILLKKIKGFEDVISIEFLQEDYIVNPVLRRILLDQFNIAMQESIDHDGRIELFQTLSAHWKIEDDKTGVTIYPSPSLSIYEDIQAIESPSAALEAIFRPEPIDVIPSNPSFVIDRNQCIFPYDYSQWKCVDYVHGGNHLLIQGPPGTGKSQTITNIISDAVYHGKTVLLISEKKVALDVVYEKLREKKLDSISYLIHDSYSDKSRCIRDIQAVYRNWLTREIHSKDDAIHAQLMVKTHSLQHYYEAYEGVDPPIGISYREVRAYANKHIPPKNKSPFLLKQWEALRPSIQHILAQIESQYGCARIADSPLRSIAHKNFSIHKMQDSTLETLQRIADLVPKHAKEPLSKLYTLGLKASLLREFVATNLIHAFDKKHVLRNEYEKHIRQIEKLEIALAKESSVRQSWTGTIQLLELQSLEDVFAAKELQSGFDRDSRYIEAVDYVKTNFDFSSYKPKPLYKRIIQRIIKAIQVEEEIAEVNSSIKFLFKAHGVEDQVSNYTYILHKLQQRDEELIYFLEQKTSISTIEQFIEFYDVLGPYYRDLQAAFIDSHDWTIDKYISEYRSLLNNRETLTHCQFYIEALHALTEREWADIIQLDKAGMDEVHTAVYFASLEYLESKFPILKNIDAPALEIILNQFKSLLQIHFHETAEAIENKVVQRFQGKVNTYSKPNSLLKSEEKIDKKHFNEGRKILEREFAKKKRFAPLRTLMHTEAASIVREIKRVWLMSPNAVSDILPLSSDLFDLVIIDESSKVGLAQAIPAIQRGKQIVIVGDEMQMPPSNFFAQQSNESEEDAYESILHKALEQLPHILLEHHYRSRSSDLIEFSNQYFYEGKLKVDAPNKNGLHFHFCENGIYADRKNKTEANLIVQQLRDIIDQNPLKSIGIACFSLEQKQCIDEAIAQARMEDKHFDRAIQAWEMMDEYFFVKNLENIQGDERDIMIISIGYGYDGEGKFRQHFGPLNNEGGERRLNVLITRAKYEMHIISSIHQYDITNEENDGANALKLFLNYAENKIIPVLNARQSDSGVDENYYAYFMAPKNTMSN